MINTACWACSNRIAQSPWWAQFITSAIGWFWEHVFCSHFMCFFVIDLHLEIGVSAFTMITMNITTFKMSLCMWVQVCILWMCLMRVESLTVQMWKGHCSCVCICISGCVRLSASACSIRTTCCVPMIKQAVQGIVSLIEWSKNTTIYKIFLF